MNVWGDIPAWVAAVGGILVIAVAVWGDDIRSWLAAPRLALKVSDDRGEQIKIGGVAGYFYHLEVTNGRPSAPAMHTRVLLTSAEGYTDSGGFQYPVSGPLWMDWRFCRVIPNREEITLRKTDFADLFWIRAADPANNFPRPTMWLGLKVRPSNFDGIFVGPIEIGLFLKAEADNAESNELRVVIQWDGSFPPRHLKLTEDRFDSRGEIIEDKSEP
jgi:hypothetical protein